MRAVRGRGPSEEGRRLDALGEQSRWREESQQKRRRKRVLRAVLSSGCDRCDAEAASTHLGPAYGGPIGASTVARLDNIG
jgi:hypothetical protein